MAASLADMYKEYDERGLEHRTIVTGLDALEAWILPMPDTEFVGFRRSAAGCPIAILARRTFDEPVTVASDTVMFYHHREALHAYAYAPISITATFVIVAVDSRAYAPFPLDPYTERNVYAKEMKAILAAYRKQYNLPASPTTNSQ